MSKVCITCNRPIKQGSPITYVMNDHYHTNCVNCKKCGASLWNKSFIKKTDGRLLCEDPCQLNTTKLPELHSQNDWQTTSTLFNQPYFDSQENYTNGYAANNENQFSFRKPQHLPSLVPQINQKGQNSNFYLKKSNQNLSNRSESPETYRSLDIPIKNYTEEVCSLCKKSVKDKEKFIYEDNIYHQDCLTCNDCECQLYRMRKIFKNPHDNFDESNYCEPCFYKFFGEKCFKCQEPVPSYCFSVRYENKLYHKECFLCVRCKKSLAKDRVCQVGNVFICKSCF